MDNAIEGKRASLRDLLKHVSFFMEVSLNNSSVIISPESSLFQLLELKELQEKKGIAVAVNNKVVPRAQWTNHTLSQNDKITVIKATQGG